MGKKNLEMVGWICRSRACPQLSARPATFDTIIIILTKDKICQNYHHHHLHSYPRMVWAPSIKLVCQKSMSTQNQNKFWCCKSCGRPTWPFECLHSWQMAFGRLKKVDLQEVSLICSALQLPKGLKSLCAGIMAEGTCGATVVIARVSVCPMTMRMIGMMGWP